MKGLATLALSVTTAVVAISGPIGCTSVDTILTATTAQESTGVATVANRAPVASAGDDQTIASGQLVVLNGGGTTDADVDRLQYTWGQVAGSPTVTLVDGFSAQPRFFAPAVTASTALTFRLTVGDGQALSSDEVTITVVPATTSSRTGP